MTMALQSGIVYGPMKSRRFGISLGVNLLPTDQKQCNFHCHYCQYAETPAGRVRFPGITTLKTELRRGFESAKRTSMKPITAITLAGNGEPTLHPQFPEAVEAVLAARDAILPGVEVAILSNSTTCHSAKIRKALMRLDRRFMKLDAGTRKNMVCVNAPTDKQAWKKIIGGLKKLENFDLQSMFVKGHGNNSRPEMVAEWVRVVRELKPHSVQLYTISRAPRERQTLPLSGRALEEIAEHLRHNTGIPAEVFS